MSESPNWGANPAHDTAADAAERRRRIDLEHETGPAEPVYTTRIGDLDVAVDWRGAVPSTAVDGERVHGYRIWLTAGDLDRIYIDGTGSVADYQIGRPPEVAAAEMAFHGAEDLAMAANDPDDFWYLATEGISDVGSDAGRRRIAGLLDLMAFAERNSDAILAGMDQIAEWHETGIPVDPPDPPSTPLQELEGAYRQAIVLADGEAIAACEMLLSALRAYLPTEGVDIDDVADAH